MSATLIKKFKILAVLACIGMATAASTCNTNNEGLTPDINSSGGGQKLNDPAPTDVGNCGTLAITGDPALMTGSTHTYSATISGTCDNPVHSWSIADGYCTINGSTSGTSVDVTGGTSATCTLRDSVSCGNCTGSPLIASQQLGVTAMPDCTITAAAPCANTATNTASVADAGVGAVYTWTVTGGTIISGQGTRTITYSVGASGTVSIHVHITNATCECEQTRELTIASAPNCTITAPALPCPNSTGNIASVADAGVGATYNWSITNGTITAGQGTRTITFTAGASGSVTLAVDVSVGSCACHGTLQVQLNDTLNCTITARSPCPNSTGNTACVPDAGAETTYVWSITGGTITAGQNTPCITYTAGDSGNVVITVDVSMPGCACPCHGSLTLPISPNPDCTITANNPCPSSTGNTASVPDAGSGATYVWTLTGGTITAGQGTNAITYTANASGSVVIDVSVTTAAGCSCSSRRELTISSVLNCTITANTPCPNSTGNTASVADAGVGATYNWSITGGTITAGQGTNTITYTAGASGSVVLTVDVARDGCSCHGSLTVQINAAPTCTITALPPCPNSTGNTASVASAGLGAVYNWSITGGTITGGQGTASITYTAGASGSVVFTVDVTNSSGCSCHGTLTVQISAAPDCTITANAPCPNSTSNTASVPDAGVGATYVWSITGGTITAGQGTRTITYTAGASGSVVFTVDVTKPGAVGGAAGCTCHGTLTVQINAAPNCTITANNPCPSSTGNTASVADAGAGATYAWTVTNGTITAGQGSNTITYTAGASGTVVINVNVTNAAGCSCHGSKEVAINPAPNCTITASPSCPGSTGNTASVADAGVGAVYVWSLTGGTITAGQGTNTITYTTGNSSSLVFTVDVTLNGCSCHGTLTLGVAAALSCSIAAPTQGGLFTGTITGGTAPYICSATIDQAGWVVDSCGVDNGGNGPGFTVTYHRTTGSCSPVAPPLVTVVIFDELRCTSSCSQAVPCPPGGCIITGPSFICEGGSAQLCVTPATGTVPPVLIHWTGPNGFSSTDSCITVTTPGVYTATVTDGNGVTSVCCAPVAKIKIKGIATPCANATNLPYNATVDLSGAADFSGTLSWAISGNGTFCDGSTSTTGPTACVHAGAVGSFTLSVTVQGLINFTCNGTEESQPLSGTCTLVVPVISCP